MGLKNAGAEVDNVMNENNSRIEFISILCLFLICLCSLAVEVSLTRLFSVIFIHSYVYLIVSISMAGLGVGAVLLYYMSEDLRVKYFKFLIVSPISTLLVLVVFNNIYVSVFLSLLLTILLFIYIGSCTTLVFLKSKASISVLYAADLVGASVGAIACYFFLNSFGGIKTILILLIVLSFSICLLTVNIFGNSRKTWYLAVAILIPAIVMTFFSLDGLVTPANNRLKDMATRIDDKTDNPRIIESRWTAFGRSDLLETDNPYFKTLYIDGAAGTKMLRMDSESIDPQMSLMLQTQYIGGVALLPVPMEKRQDALVVGSGGGIDVVTLLAGKFENITAVEINPDFIDIVNNHKEYNGGIYDHYPNVKVVNEEGRSFIRKNSNKYDVILMSLPIIKSSRGYDSYALSENYLFTHNAFDEYRKSLKSDGFLVIVAHYRYEAYRLVTNALKSFLDHGISLTSAMSRIAVIGKDSSPAVIIKKSQITKKESKAFNSIVMNFSQHGDTTFIPYVAQHKVQYRGDDGLYEKDFNNIQLYSLAGGTLSLEDFISSSLEDISWVSDDSPFFYQMDKVLPGEILVVFVFSLFMCIGLILSFYFKSKKSFYGSREDLASFGLLGFSFILVEVYVLQKFILFWGQQTLALSFILALILISTGIGSLFSGYIKNEKNKLRISLILIPLLVFSLGPLMDFGFMYFDKSSDFVKVIMSVGFVFPLFFVMGMPYPTLLKGVLVKDGARLFPWMIGINSVATLLGGVTATVIALLSGYGFVVLAGAVSYCLVLGLLWRSLFGPLVRRTRIDFELQKTELV